MRAGQVAESHRLLLAAVLIGCAGRSFAAMQPEVIETQFPTEDIVVATPVDAPSRGEVDATAAIQAAIDEAHEAGGGVLFLPVGRYRLDGRLIVHEGVTLRGDWLPPDQGAVSQGTILAIHADRGELDAPATITIEPA